MGSSTFLDDLDSIQLRECQHNCGFCLINFLTVVVVQHSSSPTLTEPGVPYIVSIFAENSAGNGTKCNVTDFTDELGESCYVVTKQLAYKESYGQGKPYMPVATTLHPPTT